MRSRNKGLNLELRTSNLEPGIFERAARRPAARLTGRYSRWPELGLHLVVSAISSG
jgi:hypothetical protein